MSFSLVDVCFRTTPSTRLAQVVLFLMSVAALSIAVERLIFYWRARGAGSVLAAGRQARAAGAGRGESRRAMERAAREHRHALGEGLRGLLTVGVLAPAVGLLATLGGAIETFRAMAWTGSESFGALGFGLSDALVPFAWALGVGGFSLVAWAVLESRRERVGRELVKIVDST